MSLVPSTPSTLNALSCLLLHMKSLFVTNSPGHGLLEIGTILLVSQKLLFVLLFAFIIVVYFERPGLGVERLLIYMLYSSYFSAVWIRQKRTFVGWFLSASSPGS